MNEELFKRLGQKLPGAPREPTFGADAYDWMGQFSVSAFASAGELVGIRPSSTTEAWRMDNPLASFASELMGTVVPYAGWFGTTKKLKFLDSAINKLGDAKKAPFLTGALQEAARFAPFEAGRVIASQFVGEEDLATMTGEAAVNLAVGAGIGGVISSIGAAGTRNFPLAKLAPGIDVAAPLQIQQRYLTELLKKGTVAPENLPQVNYRLNELRGFSRKETLPEGTRYVAGFDGIVPPKLVDNINKLFRIPKERSGFQRRRFVEGTQDFPTTAAWQQAAEAAGLPKGFEDLGQYYRYISFSGPQAATAAKAFDKVLPSGMQGIGNGWFIRQEADEGLFVMSRKVRGVVGKSDPADHWVIFKTDAPGEFTPKAQQWANTIVVKNAWNPVAKLAEDGGEIYNAQKAAIKTFPLVNYRVLLSDSKGIAAAIDKLMPKKFGRRQNELLGRMKDVTLEYLTPARVQFAKSPVANWIHTMAKMTYDAAETEGQKILYGALQLDPKKSLFWSALKGQQQENAATRASVKTLLDSIDETGIKEFNLIRRTGLHGKELDAKVIAGEIAQSSADFARKIEVIDSEIWQSMNKAQKATGHTLTSKTDGYYGLSKQWLGDTRIALRGDNGEVVAIAAGFNRKGAQVRAQEIQAALEKEGRTTRLAEEFEISQMADIPKDIRPVILNPSFTMESQSVRGWFGDFEDLTREELMKAFESSVRGKLRYQANLSVTDVFQRDLDRLASADPHGFKLLTARMNDLAGVQGPLGKIQNQIADKLLAPILGQNSASKIVSATNSTMMHLQLGAMKIAYPVMNAMTFMQNVMPEAVYITTAAAEHKAGKYTYFAAGGTNGPVGVVGSLNPITLMVDSVRLMRKPTAELLQAFERATNERVIDPRLVEEYIGESATKLTDWRSALGSPGGFGKWIIAASEFLPAISERLSRAHAFTVGHMVAKHIGIKDPEAAYRLARQFTEHTMYLYSVADRPRMFTTPAGSFFGLFKNWMANYTATMLEYMGEGVARNNWAPLLWQTAGTFAVGGVSATPLALAADGFSKAFTGNSLLENTYKAFGEDNSAYGDGLMYGLPAFLSGGHISLYSQAASPTSNPVRDATMLFSTAHIDRMQYFTKAMGAGWDHWQATGEHPGRDPRFLEQLTRALAPVTMYRIMGAAQEGMIKSLSSGYPIQSNVGLMDRLFYMAGFNSVDMDKGYAVAEQLFAKQEAHQAEVARLGQAFADYQMGKDNQGMNRVLKQAYASGIDPSSVLRSAQARVSKMTTPLLERNFKPEDLARFSQVLGTSP